MIVRMEPIRGAGMVLGYSLLLGRLLGRMGTSWAAAAAVEGHPLSLPIR